MDKRKIFVRWKGRNVEKSQPKVNAMRGLRQIGQPESFTIEYSNDVRYHTIPSLSESTLLDKTRYLRSSKPPAMLSPGGPSLSNASKPDRFPANPNEPDFLPLVGRL